jgi:hypothetical protein
MSLRGYRAFDIVPNFRLPCQMPVHYFGVYSGHFSQIATISSHVAWNADGAACLWAMDSRSVRTQSMLFPDAVFRSRQIHRLIFFPPQQPSRR